MAVYCFLLCSIAGHMTFFTHMIDFRWSGCAQGNEIHFVAIYANQSSKAQHISPVSFCPTFFDFVVTRLSPPFVSSHSFGLDSTTNAIDTSNVCFPSWPYILHAHALSARSLTKLLIIFILNRSFHFLDSVRETILNFLCS